MDPKNKTVLITGSARGIGFYTAREFVRAGSHVILTDLDPDALETASQKLESFGGVLDTYQVDVSNREAVDEMASDVLTTHGDLDVLINNAGIPLHEKLADTTIEQWEQVFGVNFFGPLYHIYAFLPEMIDRGEGHIVNISSGQAFFMIPTWGAYATSKLAIGGFSEVLHHELEKDNIGVTTVYPYIVNTDFYGDVDDVGGLGSRLINQNIEYVSHDPEDIGKTVFQATVKEKKSEMTSVLNWAGYYLDFVPGAKGLVTQLTDYFMTR